jgi:hypothetical protein
MPKHAYSEVPIATIPQDILVGIGNVIVTWGRLEHIVDLMIAKLSGFELFDQRGAIVTAHMTWPLKMDILESLVTAFVPDHPHLKGYDAIKTLLKKAQEGRNKIAHGQWGHEDGITHKLRATARGKLKASIDPITVADLEAINVDVHLAAVCLWKFVLNVP